RVHQWIKNLFLFAGIIFARQFDQPAQLVKVMVGFVAFCMISSALYILNDWVDIEKDRKHPKKKYRPLASGAITIPLALGLMLALLGLGVGVAFDLGWYFVLLALTYAGLTIGYTFYLKHIPIIDVMTIAAGFLLRTVAGTVAINVRISPWLIVCVGLLSLFLAFTKRRQELLTTDGTATRQVLGQYSLGFLDQALNIVTAATLTSYFLYTFTARTQWMMITIPFVLFGIFRYLLLSQTQGEGEEPEQIIYSDIPFLVNLVIWTVVSGLIIYFK
ncbi:MAG: decaprenyl-phosphate phosphoribosyltransferase, partial [Bacillota bacterium]